MPREAEKMVQFTRFSRRCQGLPQHEDSGMVKGVKSDQEMEVIMMKKPRPRG
jgi:hypothetical protein